MPDKNLAAVCGLFCPACTLYIGTHEDPERLKALSEQRQRPVEDLLCDGCRSERRCFHCNETCRMVKCAAENGIDFCGACAEYPCADLKEFQSLKPHRLELWRNQELITNIGYEQWYLQMIDRYSCRECRTLNSTYDLQCRKCGASPSCDYVALHRDKIICYMDRTGARG